MLSDNKQLNNNASALPQDAEGQQEISKALGAEGKLDKNGKPIKQTVVIKDDDIHTMPTKFLSGGRPPDSPTEKSSAQAPGSGGGNGKKIVLIFVILVVFLGAIIGGGLWYIKQANKVPEVVVNTNTNVNQNDNTNTNTNDNTNDNVNTNTNVNQNDNTNTNTNDNTNTNTNDNVPPPPALPTNLVDADNDGLSQLEEGIYFTNSNREDTDRDGYKDGVEVSNLYDPLVPNALLEDSGLVTKYTDAATGYTLLRPKDWPAETSGENEVVFLPNSETGEFFSILALPNESGLSLEEVFDEISDMLQPRNNYVNFSLAKNPALKSMDGFSVLMVSPSYIYVIDYQLGQTTEANFVTTFDMMLKSFGLGENIDEILSDV